MVTGKDDRPGDAAALRRRAEEVARAKAAQAPGEGEAASLAEAEPMLYELRVHQIELEMQAEDLRRAQVELEAARSHYAELYDMAPVGYCVVSREGTILQANLTVATQLGVARGVLVNQPITRFIHRDDQDIYYLHHRRLMESGEQQQCEMRMVKPDGTAFWARLETTSAQDGDGVPVRRVVLSDITERKHAEEALRESEALHQSIFRASPDGIAVTDMVGCLRMASPSALAMFGYARQEDLQGRAFAELLIPEDRERAQVSIALMLEGVYERPGTFRGLRADGSTVAIEANGEFIRDEHGHPAGMVFIVRDITARMRADEELRRSESLLQRVFDILPVGLWFADADGKLLRGNPEGVRIWGAEPLVDPSEYGVFKARRLPSGEEVGPDDWALTRTLRDGATIADELLEIDAFDGVTRVVLNHTAPVLDEQGRAQGAIVVNQDVTDLKRAENEVRAAHELLYGVVDSVPIRVFWKDTDLVYLGCNTLFAQDAGFARPEDIIGKDDRAMGWREQAELYRADDSAVIESGKSRLLYEEQQTTPSGGRIHVLTSKVLLRDGDGRVVGVLGAYLDITARKQAEQALAAAAGQWRQTFDAMSDAVFLSDGQGRILRCNAATEALTGRPFTEIIGRSCYEVLHDAVGYLPDCPQRRAFASGRAESNTIEQDGRWLRIAFQPLFEADGESAGGVHVVSDVSELKRAEHSLRESLGAQEAVTAGVIEALVRSVEARDPFTAGHQRRVSELVVAMAARLGLEPSRVEGLRVGGLLHDVGKITIPAEILSKPGRLTAMEFALIKGHAEAGGEILQAIPFPWPIAAMAAQHHEREDGSGYPAGLSGEAILSEARLLAVADVVEAMASHRPYRPAPGIAAALAEIHEGAGTRYDAAVVAACEQVFAEGFGFGDGAAT